jgi:hypothetical protein
MILPRPRLAVRSGTDRGRTQPVLEKSERACLVSASLSSLGLVGAGVSRGVLHGRQSDGLGFCRSLPGAGRRVCGHGIIRRQIQFSTGHSWRHLIGRALIGYALAYPFINLAQADHFLREPTFGVPCPTTMLTIGLLLPAAMPSWRLAVIPIVWSVIAGQADIFTVEVARMFHRRIATCLAQEEIEAILADQRYQATPQVNAVWPVTVPLDFVPPQLLATLPQLPPELQYRIFGRSLVLWEHHANPIVDTLPWALTPEGA